ncbi:hypothetical protein ACOSQ3_018251 [Xanthoceras sorbifolium]
MPNLLYGSRIYRSCSLVYNSLKGLRQLWSASHDCYVPSSGSLIDFLWSCKSQLQGLEFEELFVILWHILFRRNHFVHSAGINLGFSPIVVEAMALKRGIELTLEFDIFPILVESDALALINIIIFKFRP